MEISRTATSGSGLLKAKLPHRCAGKPDRREIGIHFCASEQQMSIENLIRLIGGIVLPVYLFVVLTHPDRF